MNFKVMETVRKEQSDNYQVHINEELPAFRCR